MTTTTVTSKGVTKEVDQFESVEEALEVIGADSVLAKVNAGMRSTARSVAYGKGQREYFKVLEAELARRRALGEEPMGTRVDMSEAA